MGSALATTDTGLSSGHCSSFESAFGRGCSTAAPPILADEGSCSRSYVCPFVLADLLRIHQHEKIAITAHNMRNENIPISNAMIQGESGLLGTRMVCGVSGTDSSSPGGLYSIIGQPQ